MDEMVVKLGVEQEDDDAQKKCVGRISLDDDEAGDEAEEDIAEEEEKKEEGSPLSGP